MMEIRWKNGYQAKIKAEDAFPAIEKIRKRDGEATPEAVLEAAGPKRSKLHKAFEWDDGIAGQKHRMWQARKLLGSIELISADAPEIPFRAYTVVSRAAKGKETAPRKVYLSTEEALRDPGQRDEILANAIREALAYRKKYAQLQELAVIFAAMDDFLLHFKEA